MKPRPAILALPLGSCVCAGKSVPILPMRRPLRLLPLLLALPLHASHADSRVDWHTVDGGGGESTAGRFSIRGTAGQPDADEVSLCSAGGAPACAAPRFEVTGGFWVPGSATVPDDDALFSDGFES